MENKIVKETDRLYVWGTVTFLFLLVWPFLLIFYSAGVAVGV